MTENIKKSLYFGNRKWLLLLAIIMMVGYFLRVWNIVLPETTINRDEAALGYNAFLLSETGKDEWGQSWPLMLKSFGDYKLPGYPLLLIGSFSVFGVNDFAVRFPSLLAGVIIIGASYLIGQQFGLTKKWALIFVTLITITPVFVFYSRFAYEANVSLLYSLGVVIILWSLNDKDTKKIWSLKVFCAATIGLLALFTYNTPMLQLPLFLVVWVLTHRHLSLRKKILSSALFLLPYIFSVIILLPLISQKSGITIFTDVGILHQINEYHQSFSDPFLQKLIGNKWIFYVGIMMDNFTSSFSADFLVYGKRLHPWHNIPGFGHIFLVVYAAAMAGIVYALSRIVSVLIGNKKANSVQEYFILIKQKGISVLKLPEISLLLLALTGLVSSIITVDSPHTTRSLFFIYCLSLLVILFLRRGMALLANRTRIIVMIIAIGLISVNFTHWYSSLLQDYSKAQKELYQFGLQEALSEVDKTDQPIAVLDQGGYYYVLFAWYLKMPPTEYFKTVIRQQPNEIGFSYGEQVGKYHFIGQKVDISEKEKLMFWDEVSDAWIF